MDCRVSVAVIVLFCFYFIAPFIRMHSDRWCDTSGCAEISAKQLSVWRKVVTSVVLLCRISVGAQNAWPATGTC